jgi:polar amino acid transport system substrate-binding protein
VFQVTSVFFLPGSVSRSSLLPAALLLAMLASAAIGAIPRAALAQQVSIPNFWDPNERFLKPDLASRPRVRFLTTTDFPPFNFIDRKKRLTGFHVDLARAICEELDILPRCQIQALPWDELHKAMEDGGGDAIIAGLEVTESSRKTYDFSRTYLSIPARFVTRRAARLEEPVYENLFRKTVGVVLGSVHAKFFEQAFGERKFLSFPTRQTAFNALKDGSVDAVFTDALSASFWLASTDSDECCAFSGGPYISHEFFGDGMAIAVNKGDTELAEGFNYALKAINDNGTFRSLYLKYFPLGLF